MGEKKTTVLQTGWVIYSADGKKQKLYKLLERIVKEGGETPVQFWKASDLASGRLCFLKMLPVRLSPSGAIQPMDKKDEYLVSNLKREAGFRFYHPYIEHVYGAFLGENRGGQKYFVVCVEYVEGDNLTKELDRLNEEVGKGVCSEEEKEKIIFRQIYQFLCGMNYYLRHARSAFLHRDLKPDNIMVCGDRTIKIVDFDYAHISGSTDTINFRNNLGMTAGYTSPKAVRCGAAGETILPDETDEIYAAGRLLFFWLNGKHYFDESERSRTGDFMEIPYVKDPDLGYGTREERYIDRYRGRKYAPLRQILDKMCAWRDIKDTSRCYQHVGDIISEYLSFLKSLYGQSTVVFEEILGISRMPLLQEKASRFTGGVPFIAYKITGQSKVGMNLYKFGMFDLCDKKGNIFMTIYNLEDDIYYIPVSETVRVGSDCREDDYIVHNGDRFCCLKTGGDKTEITFQILP